MKRAFEPVALIAECLRVLSFYIVIDSILFFLSNAGRIISDLYLQHLMNLAFDTESDGLINPPSPHT